MLGFFRNRLVIRLERWASAICRMSTFISFWFTLLFAAILITSFAANAEPYHLANIWAEVEAYPSGSGKVYMTSNDASPVSESGWGESSESKFTIAQDGETTQYRVDNGEFISYSVPRFFGIVQVQPEEGYDCVGLVKRIDENGEYSDEDYYFGSEAYYDRTPDLLNPKRVGGAPYTKIGFVGAKGMDVDMNSGRDGVKYETQAILTEEEKTEFNALETTELQYYYYHDRVVERAAWPTEPTKIYALFKEKVSVTLDEKGEAIFSSNDNLKLQDNSDLKAYVVYKVVNVKGMLKETDSIPARLGVFLKGEPGKTYSFDRIPEPNKLVQVTSDGMKTYNGVDRRFDFKIKTDRLVFLSDYLTVAIPGGATPATFFTIDTDVTGINTLSTDKSGDERVFDLQGRNLGKDINAQPHGIYIKDGKKIAR